MNKIFTIIIFIFIFIIDGFVVGAIDIKLSDLEDSNSELSKILRNDKETTNLVGNSRIFADFCLKSRNFIISEIKEQSNALGATLFEMFFKNAAEITQNVINVDLETIEKLAAQLRNPSAPIPIRNVGGFKATIINDGQKAIADSKYQPIALFHAVKSTIAATGNAVSTSFVKSLDNLRNNFSLEKISITLGGVCEQIAYYEKQLKNSYDEFVRPISKWNKTLAATPYEDVACLTTRRLARIDGICKLSSVANNSVQRIIKTIY